MPDDATGERTTCHAIDPFVRPGPWSPQRLVDAGLTCYCRACQQEWPDVDIWWMEHTRAGGPKTAPPRAGVAEPQWTAAEHRAWKREWQALLMKAMGVRTRRIVAPPPDAPLASLDWFGDG